MASTLESEFRWGGDLVAYIEIDPKNRKYARLVQCGYRMSAAVAREYVQWLAKALGGDACVPEPITGDDHD